MLSELHSLNLKLCSKQYNKIFVLHLIVVPQLSSGWWHNYLTKTRQPGWANEQSIYSLMSMIYIKVHLYKGKNYIKLVLFSITPVAIELLTFLWNFHGIEWYWKEHPGLVGDVSKCQCYKTVYDRNLQMILISLSVLGKPFHPSLMFGSKARSSSFEVIQSGRLYY